MWSNVSWSKCREQMMRHGSDPGDVCVVQGRSVVVTWAGSGQVKVQNKKLQQTAKNTFGPRTHKCP